MSTPRRAPGSSAAASTAADAPVEDAPVGDSSDASAWGKDQRTGQMLRLEMRQHGGNITEFVVCHDRAKPSSWWETGGFSAALLVLAVAASQVGLLSHAFFGAAVALAAARTAWGCLASKRTIVSESVTVIHNMGLQLQTTFADERSTHCFIEKPKIQTVVINEGITRWRVVFYLAIVVHGQEDLVLAFKHLCPGRAILEKILQGTRNGFIC